jgi:putative membrane protein
MSGFTKTALIIGGTFLAVLLIIPMIFGLVNHNYNYGAWNWGIMGPRMMNFYGGGWYMGIFMIIFWGLVIWGIVALIRYSSRTQQCNSQGNSALDILKKRYARGEINKQEYEDMKKDLE